MKRTSEAAFETAIESVLLGDGYTRLDGKGFDRVQAIFPEEALAFIRTTPVSYTHLTLPTSDLV